jgi:hypothetical protein
MILCAGVNTVFTDAAAESIDDVEQQLSYRLNLLSKPHLEQPRPGAFKSQDYSCDISGMIGSGRLQILNRHLNLTHCYSYWTRLTKYSRALHED